MARTVTGPGVARRRFTAEEYHRMGRAGILRRDERLERLDGEIARMTPNGPRHAVSVARVTRVFFRRVGDRAVLWPR